MAKKKTATKKAPAAPETFTVTLVDAGSGTNKPKVAILIRDLTGATNVLQIVTKAPSEIKAGLSKAKAQALAIALQAAGATVTVVGDGRADASEDEPVIAIQTLKAYLTDDPTVTLADAKRATGALDRFIKARNRKIAAMRG